MSRLRRLLEEGGDSDVVALLRAARDNGAPPPDGARERVLAAVSRGLRPTRNPVRSGGVIGGKSGDTIGGGKYLLIQMIGEGATGAVWEGVNRQTGRNIALKPIGSMSDETRQRVVREVKVWARLAHPNIVEVYDVGETANGELFLEMQLLHGHTLADVLRDRRRIAPPLAARIGRDIASALAAVHAAKIVHRDIKPANIYLHREPRMYGDEFVVKIDFGASKILANIDDGPASMTGAMIGSPAYMSPEQVRVAKDLDHRTDIWSLGIVLYEMLTGARPFKGSVEEVIRQILQAPIPPVSSLERDVLPEFEAILMGCLDRNLGKRLHDALDLAHRLALCTELQSSAARRVAITVSAPAPALQQMMARAAAVDDDHDLAATLPMCGRVLGEVTVASPIPAWRQERAQALPAHRQSSSSSQATNLGEPMCGGTQPLAPEVASRALAVTAPSVEIPAAKGAKRRGGVGVRYAAIAVGFLVAGGLAALCVLNLSKPSELEGTKAEAASAASTAAPTAESKAGIPVGSADVPAAPPTDAPPPPVPPPPPQPPSTSNTAPKPGKKQLPPCGLKTNCQRAKQEASVWSAPLVP